VALWLERYQWIPIAITEWGDEGWHVVARAVDDSEQPSTQKAISPWTTRVDQIDHEHVAWCALCQEAEAA